MKKKLMLLLLALSLCFALAVPAAAADLPLLVDDAFLLSDAEVETLNRKLDEISDRLGFDVIIITVDSIQDWDMDPEGAAEWIYDEYNYGVGPNHDGVLLLISMEERDWAITSTGFGQTAINSDAQDFLSGSFLSSLSTGNYYEAFGIFADSCDMLVRQAQNGEVYKAPFNFSGSLGISLVISFLVALIAVGSMKKKLKSVAMKAAAADYVCDDSLNITTAREHYLYHTVTRSAKPQNSNSGSRGGGGHTSSHGKF